MFKKSKSTWSWTGLLAAAAFLTMSGATAQPAATATQRAMALEGGTLIDGTGKQPLADAVVVVQGDRITAVGKRGQVRVPANAQIIKTDGLTILPGLIEGHLHSFDWQAPMFLHYGVTTITDFDINPAWIISQRKMYNNGRIRGPRLFVAGGKMWGLLEAPNPVPGPEQLQIVRNPEEARAYLRSMEALGVDFLKVDDSITYPELAVAIDEGKRTGLKVLGHTQNIRLAANMGTYFAEHFWTVWNALLDPDGTKFVPVDGKLWYPKGAVGQPEVTMESMVDPKQFKPLIDFMVSKGVYFNPTMVGAWGSTTPVGREYLSETAKLANDPELAWAPAEARAMWAQLPEKTESRTQADYAKAAEFLREYSAAGGKVIVGSEGTSGLSTHYEMYMLAEAGIPPMKVIQGATLWNAEKIGKEKDLGSVEPGKLADFTIIQGNPLADITATKNVRIVIKGGQVMDTKYEPNWVNPIPRPYSPPSEIRVMSPLMAPQDSPDVTLDLTGVRFQPDSVARFDNVDLPTHFISNTKMTVTVGAQLMHNVGEHVIYIFNPGMQANISAPRYFLVDFKD